MTPKNIHMHIKNHEPLSRTRLIIVSIVVSLHAFSLVAQNTSYNINNIPIGGTNSVAVGSEALPLNTGSNNTAVGRRAMFSNTSGSGNVAIGSAALRSNTTGTTNTAIGTNAGLLNSSGSVNTGTGFDVLVGNSTGSYNTAYGGLSLRSNTFGNANTGIGTYALLQNNTGNNNTGIGYDALSSSKTGNENVALGDSAGFSSLGSGNIFIGHKAGMLETGDQKLYIGNNAAKTIIYGDLNTGQILLGRPDATGYGFKGTRTLNVMGGILADSVRVALSGTWADYVFADDYPLMSPEDLSSFIKQHRHLPGIPTQQEVEKEGISLGETNIKLLEKIEELTLYMLNQQEQIREVKKDFVQALQEINTLKEINAKQMALIKVLEKRMKALE
jgi:hypothetical protein